MKYPKIETLYNRDLETHKVIVGDIRCPEFAIVHSWLVTEKIDGTNIRVFWNPETETVTFGGRTDNAQIPAALVEYLQRTFTPDKFKETFAVSTMPVILFGEGYGARIQNGGGYRPDVSFRLFDVWIGMWLKWESVIDVANSLNILTAPIIERISYLPSSLSELKDICPYSQTALFDSSQNTQAEGIVARSEPLLLDRLGNRVMWKLKFRDF